METKKLSLIEKYENEKNKIKVLECDKCKKEFLLKSINIEKYLINDEKHKLHFVFRFFVCQHCGQVYPVGIDDDYSQFLQRLLQNDFNLLDRISKKIGKEVKEKKLRELKKRQNKISVYRQSLMEKYSEAFTVLVMQQLKTDK